MTRPSRLFLPFALALVSWGPSRAGDAGATAPPRLQDVLHRWLVAIEGDGTPAPVGSVALRGEATEDGIASRVEESLERGSWRRVTTQQSKTREEVCRGGTAWLKDWNGKVVELAGRDRRDQLTVAFVEALLFGDAARAVAKGTEVTLGAEDEARASGILHFSPDNGIPFDLFLDNATGLPAKAVRKPYDDTIVLEFSDWRTVEGRRIPFVVRESGGESGGEATTTFHEIVPSRRTGQGTFGRPPDGPKDYRFAHGRGAPSIPFNFENDHIMVQGRINGGTPLWFMLDTGAEATIVNKARMSELGLTPFGVSTITGGGHSTDFAFTEVARLTVGGVELLGQRDGVIDLRGLERVYGMPMGGLLGYDFLSRFIVRVDYDARTIDLLEPSGFSYSGRGTRVPFLLEQGHPHVTSTVTVASGPPIPADMVVDAGAAGTVNLNSPFVKAHRLLERARKRPAGEATTMAGSEKEFFAQTLVRGRLGTFTLGAFELKDVPTSLMMGTTGGYASGSFSGTIGQGVLHRFNTVYDYSRSRMFLEPNAQFGSSFTRGKTFGVTLLSDASDYTVFTVTGVAKGSPAESAGLRKGDVIAAVDGKPASELRLADVRKLLAEDGAHRVIEVRRGGESVTLDITLNLAAADEG